MSTDAVHIYLYYFLCAFGFSLSVPFIYIVIVKSPATLKVYRNTILNLTFWYLASMFAVVMLQPVHAMYGTKSCARFVGLVSLFDFEAHVAVIFCVGVSCENVAVAICVCFFYRYAQLRRMNMAASGSSFGLRLCLIGHIVGSIAMGSLGYVLVTYAEWKKVDGVYAMCFDDSNYFVIIRIAVGAVALLTFAGAVVLILATASITVLKKQSVFMSTQTYRLQKLLTMNLIVLVVLPFGCDFFPVVIAAFAIYLKSPSLISLIVGVALHTPFLDVVFTCIATVVFVTPYRQALKYKICGVKVTPAVSLVSSTI